MHEQPNSHPSNDPVISQSDPAINSVSDVGTRPSPTTQPAPPSMGRPVTPTYEPLQPPPPQGPSKVLIGIAGAALVLVAFGIIRSMVADPEPPKPKRQAQPSLWQQQQQMAREAIDMAKESQRMQREHMEQMRRAMEDDYGYMQDGIEGYDGN